MKSRVVFSAWIAFALLGCGGSPGGVQVAGGASTVVVGPVTLTGSMSAPVVSNPSGGAAAYALSGNITGASLTTPDASLASTEIIFQREGANGYEIAAVAPDGSGFRSIIANLPSLPTQIQVSPNGQFVYYVRSNTLIRVGILGGSPQTICPTVGSFAITPSGNAIVVKRSSSGSIQTLTATGVVSSTIGTFAGTLTVVGCVKENLAVVVELDNMNLRQVRPLATTAGSSLQQSIAGLNNGGAVCTESATPSIIFSGTSSGWSRHFLPFGYDGFPCPFAYFGAASPDGKWIVRSLNVGGPVQLIVREIGSTEDLVIRRENVGVMAWSPIIRSRSVVGAGSIFGTSIGALLFSQGDTHVKSFVAADATTRSSLTVTTQAQGGNSSVFQIQGDRLNKLQYTDGNAFIVKSIDVTSATVKGAVVAFDGETGKLTTLLTYTKAPTFRKLGNLVEVTGELTDVVGNSRKARAMIR